MKKSRLLKIVLLLLLLLIPAVYLVRLSIFPGFFVGRPDAIYGQEAYRTEFLAADGTPLRGWFFNRGQGSPLVAVYTGNNMNVGGVLSLALADTSRSYLMLNYRGYGDSEGVPSESRLVADARHCIAEARRRIGGQSTPLHIVGYSIGSGVANQVAAAESPATLTLICPFDSITEVACDFVPLLPRLLLPNTFVSTDFAPRITCPVTVLRAEADALVTAPHTAALLRAYPTPPREHVLPADHNSVFFLPEFIPLVLKSLENGRFSGDLPSAAAGK